MRLTSSQPHSPGILISSVPAPIALVVLRLLHWACLARSETDLRHHCDSLEPTSNGSSPKHHPPLRPSKCASPKSRHSCRRSTFPPCHAERKGLVFRHVRNGLHAFQIQQFHAWI
ncbi:hypothetical protein BKA58DRAFT_119863 [Alternaria rosae]|uniref:uncharacterized protein n=1 Tax=Alternaria rosae TaxID=1187941 RepID=UPI001E8D5EBB|nr:uncharacterized protein BKA58DRAFT_119863 [Alternaria rosae]KAH6875370.1 hypothetical protein BKA58DRAFT_119863 [Alternaria rosae]